MTIRDKRQKEFADIWLSHGKFGILNLCPRFGKIRTTINILDQMNDNCTMLIAYPDNKIKQSWIDEFELMGYINENITYTTHRSIEKNLGEYDIIIIDEIHLLSEAQTNTCKELIEQNDYVLGLTGTLSKWSKKELVDFVEQLNTTQFQEVQAFFDTMPRLQHTMTVKNPKTKVESEVTLTGLNDFFV